jgi:tetratricopeptide (TPR) repeat protein
MKVQTKARFFQMPGRVFMAILTTSILLWAVRPGMAQQAPVLLDEVTSLVLAGYTVDPTSLTQALAEASEQVIYELGEHSRLLPNFDNERRVFEILCQRFPQSAYVPKARFELAFIHLLTIGNWPKSAELFDAVSREFPGTGFDEEALAYAKAVRAPSTVMDAEILIEVYRTARYDLGGMVSMDFAARRLADVIGPANLTAQIIGAELPIVEKAYLLRESAYLACAAGRAASAETVFNEILARPEFTSFTALHSYCHYMLGYIYCNQMKRYDEGLAQYQTVVNQYAQGAEADDCFWEMGVVRELKGDWNGAYQNYRQIIVQYPKSPLVERALIKTGGLGPLLAANTRVPALPGATGAIVTGARWLADRSVAFRSPYVQLASATKPPERPAEPSACGPAAIRAACEALHVAVTAEESTALCRVDEGGRTSFLTVANALRKKGLEVQACEIGMAQLESLAAAKTPVILHLRNHFAFLKGLDAKHAVLVDERGEYALPLDFLFRRWDGYVLIVGPRPQVAMK